jgi:hypothetical protein
MKLMHAGHPIHAHAAQGLDFPGALHGARISPRAIRFALACAGVGLDHLAGEQALVYSQRAAGIDGDQGISSLALVTDRRLCGITSPRRGSAFDARFSAIQRVAPDTGFLAVGFVVYFWNGQRVQVGVPFEEKRYLAFLSQLATVPPEHREPSPIPLCAPSPEDPSGASHAKESLLARDPTAEALLRFVAQQASEGAMDPNTARDFVARVVLHHRNVHCGRGMTSGAWMSPVGAVDLVHCLAYLFGAPLAFGHWPHITADYAAVFRGQVGHDLARTGVLGTVLSNFANLGGWKSPVHRFRLTARDTAPFASFGLWGPDGTLPLHEEAAELLIRIDTRLLALEEDVLVRRVVRGWTEDVGTLLAQPAPDLRSLSS